MLNGVTGALNDGLHYSTVVSPGVTECARICLQEYAGGIGIKGVASPQKLQNNSLYHSKARFEAMKHSILFIFANAAKN